MKTGKKLISFILMITLLGIFLAGCGKSDTSAGTSTAGTVSPLASDNQDNTAGNEDTATGGQELKPLRLAVMTGMFNHYTALIGKEQGIYEKYGIDLEISEYAAGINTVDALSTGQADIGYAADFAIVNRIGNSLDATDLLIVSEVQGGPVNGGLYVAPEYADNLQALDGKGFINTVGTVAEYYNSNIFKYLGFDESKQNLLNSDNPQTGLALAQKGDAAAVFASGANAKLYEGIGWVKAIDANELGISTYSFDLATQEFNKNNPQLIADYLKATQESYEYIMNNLDESAAYLESTLGVDAEVVKSDWSVAESAIGFSEEGASQLESLVEWAYQNGKFDKEYDIRNFINTDALKIAFPGKVTLAQ